MDWSPSITSWTWRQNQKLLPYYSGEPEITIPASKSWLHLCHESWGSILGIRLVKRFAQGLGIDESWHERLLPIRMKPHRATILVLPLGSSVRSDVKKHVMLLHKWRCAHNYWEHFVLLATSSSSLWSSLSVDFDLNFDANSFTLPRAWYPIDTLTRSFQLKILIHL